MINAISFKRKYLNISLYFFGGEKEKLVIDILQRFQIFFNKLKKRQTEQYIPTLRRWSKPNSYKRQTFSYNKVVRPTSSYKK